ncbi:MAG: hypothetical protein V1758_10580 [Pseudomonadota bacterium]
MGKKKKPPKKSIAASPTLLSEEKTPLENLLGDLQRISPSNLKEQIPTPGLARALVDNLPIQAPETPGILAAVSEVFDQKEVRKAVKKALFKLRQRGVTLPEKDDREAAQPVFKKIEQPESSAYLGPVDGMGSRAVFVSVPHMKGLDLGMGVVNDEQGIMEFIYGPYNRKQAREVEEIFFKRVPDMVKTTLSHAATVLERAYDQKGTGRSANHYLQLRPWLLEKAPLLDRPPIHDLLSLDSPAQNILTESQIQKLLEHELMVTWVIDLEELKPIVAEIIKAEESPILVSQGQRLERIKEIKESSLLKLYPDAKRALVKGRLEEMAYTFFKLGEETHARLSLAAALSLDEKDTLLRVNPFLKALLDRSLHKVLQFGPKTKGSTKAGGDSSSRIILP